MHGDRAEVFVLYGVSISHYYYHGDVPRESDLISEFFVLW